MEYTVRLNSSPSQYIKNTIKAQELKQSPQQSQQSLKQIVLKENKTVIKYVNGVAITSKNTAREYLKRLTNFQGFVSQKYDLTLDELITTKTTRGQI
jgi:3-deoxy-D-arabino-heptulosonate 7-phosphate (DAHP) synthase